MCRNWMLRSKSSPTGRRINDDLLRTEPQKSRLRVSVRKTNANIRGYRLASQKIDQKQIP